MAESLSEMPLPPGRSGWPLIGETLAFLKDPFTFIAERVAIHGPVFRTHILGNPTAILVGPEVSGVFLDDRSCIRDGSMPNHVRELFGGRSLGLLDGLEHRSRKRQILAAFVPEALPAYVPDMQAAVETAFRRWVAAGEIAGIEELKRLAITVIAKSTLSLDPGPTLETLLTSFATLVGGFTGLPIALPGTAYKKGLRARDVIFAILGRIVTEHRESHTYEDGLARMLAFEGEGRERMTDEQAVMELHHIVIAGYIIFAEFAAMIIELSRRPELRERLEAEIRASSPSGALDVRTLAKMPILGRVVQETKRVTPVVPLAFARARKTFEVGGYRIPEGMMIHWAPYTHHQDAAVFSNPGEFDPERFSDERAEDKRHVHAFAPQGMGPATGHKCPGTDYTTVFMQVFAAVSMRDYTWTLPEQNLDLDFGRIPPEPKDGLRVVFSKRDESHTATSGIAAGMEPRTVADPDAAPAMLPLDRDSFLALASVLWADARLTDDEVDLLVTLARRSGIDDAAIRDLETRIVRNVELAEVPALSLSPAQSEYLYSLACLVSAADGTVDPSELVVVGALGDRLALDPETRQRAAYAAQAIAAMVNASPHVLAALAREVDPPAAT